MREPEPSHGETVDQARRQAFETLMPHSSASVAWAEKRVDQAAKELFNKLHLAFPEADLRQDIKSGLFATDGLAVFEKDKRLFAFELKITTPKNFRNRLVEAAIALSSTVAPSSARTS